MTRMTAPIWKKMILIPQRNRTLATVATLLVLLLAASCGDTTEPQVIEVIKEVPAEPIVEKEAEPTTAAAPSTPAPQTQESTPVPVATAVAPSTPTPQTQESTPIKSGGYRA